MTWLGRLYRHRPRRLLVGYCALGLIVTHVPPFLPKVDDGREPPLVGFDKVVHFVGFGVLALLLMNVLRRHLSESRAAGVALLLCAVAGAIDEITQPPFGRTADVMDWVADMLGAVTVTTLWIVMERRSVPVVQDGSATSAFANPDQPT